MIREIKFRGKSITTGEWLYGTYYIQRWQPYPIRSKNSPQQETESHYIVSDTGFADWGMCRTIETVVDPKTVGQFVGRKDKHGKEIYEDDIRIGHFYCADSPKEYTIYNLMKWDENNMCFYWEGQKMEDWMDDGIIGNIWDNPELLKEETK